MWLRREHTEMMSEGRVLKGNHILGLVEGNRPGKEIVFEEPVFFMLKKRTRIHFFFTSRTHSVHNNLSIFGD